MAYERYKYIFINSNEIEFHWKGDYGAKGESRAPKKKKTKEQIAIANQVNKVIRMRRVLKANFFSDDLWCCFKYPAGTKISVDDLENDRSYFLRILRAAYKKAGSELKFASRIEIGEHGGLHFHMAMNRIWNTQTDVIITDCWKRTLERSFERRRTADKKTQGLVDFKPMYDAGGFNELAKYICKQPEKDSEEYEQLSMFEEKEQKKLLKISTSRNLIRPEPEKKEYHRLTMRKILLEGPVPTPGYYIDKDSIVSGINPFTGLSYLKYTEIRLNSIDDKHPPERRGIP